MNLFAWDEPFGSAANPPKPQRELKALAGTLQRVDPDVVALQEVGSREALNDVNGLLADPFPHVVLAETNSDRGIHLGYLSRWPLLLTQHRECPLLDADGGALTDYPRGGAVDPQPLRLSRDLPFARFEVDGQAFVFANVHLKSSGTRAWQSLSSLTIRTAEVRVLAELVAEHQRREPSVPLLIAGDFNDNPTSVAFAPLDDLDDAQRLFDPLLRELVPKEPRVSTYWPRRRARIDRFLLNRAARERYQAQSIRVWRDTRAERASDHVPVSVDIQVRT